MLLFLIGVTAAIVVFCMAYAYKRHNDIFHPVIITGPIFLFIYVWMPVELARADALNAFFYPEQLWFVQSINALGVLLFLIGCLSVSGLRYAAPRVEPRLPELAERKLLAGSIITGALGFAAWAISLRNVGGVSEAFSHPYSGGWDDSGYIRDGALLMFPAVILAIAVLVNGRRRRTAFGVVTVFILPWVIQAFFTSRRGPTFMIATVLAAGWWLNRRRRPPAILALAGGVLLGYCILLLVVNRSEIYLGSDFNIRTDVNSFLNSPDSGNEYIYGSGVMLSSRYTGRHFWGRRYLAQILVRPIPSSIWPTKYEDFGVAELLQNAGTGATIPEALGWQGAPGSAPGVVADLWVEFSWLALPAMWAIGWGFGEVWKRAVYIGREWPAEYTILISLSIYLIMQTLEAVIFRFFLLSIPVWLSWYAVNRISLKPRLLRQERVWLSY